MALHLANSEIKAVGGGGTAGGSGAGAGAGAAV